MLRGLHWFRADLRVTDNTALAAAMQNCHSLLAVYILTPKTWQQHDAAPIKIQFILNNLITLSKRCQELGIALLIRQCDTFSDCSQVIENICAENAIDALFFNKQYELDELRRDALVTKKLAPKIQIHDFDDQLVMPPGTVLSSQEKPLQIFTPFKNVWLKRVSEHDAWKPVKTPHHALQMILPPDPIPSQLAEFECKHSLENWPAGEKAAQTKLQNFCDTQLNQYHVQRDFPSIAGTSQLSPYLAQGVLHPGQCIDAVMNSLAIQNFQLIQLHQGAATWISELIWREFYKHIMFFHPEVCRYKPYKANTDQIPWRYDEQDFKSWCDGKTGFPFVDAAMRQLNQTGWMHNRLRMVVAMFLSKTLILDWRLGEKYFMQNLIDGDLSANNGGWQWSASTGTDAVPYFRIFNPITQSQRFDPSGEFIRRFCPELARCDNKTIHNPHELGAAVDYPHPIVNYTLMRSKAIAAFKALK